MSHLLRKHAPITEKGWDELDTEAKQQLTTTLAARKLVDFEGPLGWEHSATNVGRAEGLGGELVEGVSSSHRRVLPLVELRASFTVSRAELDDLERGAVDIDLDELDAAANRIAIAENTAVFRGFEKAGIEGVCPGSSHPPVSLTDDFNRYPNYISKAVEMLLSAGVEGPYGLALSPESYTGVVEGTEHGGYPLFDHLRKIVQGPLVWAPGLTGAVVLSLRGGDFLFQSGQDISIGYESHDAETVHLYLEESFSFRIASPEAGVSLNI